MLKVEQLAVDTESTRGGIDIFELLKSIFTTMNIEDDNVMVEKVFLAFANFVIGTACVALALISLSIVPDCAGSISGQVLTYFVVQCVVELAALLMTTLSVSYMLAVSDGVFINESFDDVPGYTLIVCLITAACLQFFSSLYKFLETISPSLCNKVFNKVITFLTIIGAFIAGSNRFVDDIFAKKVLKFQLNKHRWVYNITPENFWINNFLGIACILLTILCFFAVIRILVDNFVLIKDRRYLDKFEVFKNVASTVLLLLMDLVYAGLVFYTNFRTIPNSKIRVIESRPFGLKMPKVSLSDTNTIDGYIQGYIVFIWPIIGMIVNYKWIRKVIKIRSDLMVSRSQMPRARAPRRPSSIPKKISTIENPESVHSSSNTLLGTSQNSLAQIESGTPKKKISTVSQHSLSIPEVSALKSSPPETRNNSLIPPDPSKKRVSLVLENRWASQDSYVQPPRHKISTISQYSMQEPTREMKRMSLYSAGAPLKKTSIVLTPSSSMNSSQEWVLNL